jgi:hypothetical protein
MTQPSDRQQLIDEINLIPESHLRQLFDLLHYFRLGLQASNQSNVEAIMSHAGDWDDLDDGTIENFETEIRTRRAQAFTHRMRSDSENAG